MPLELTWKLSICWIYGLKRPKIDLKWPKTAKMPLKLTWKLLMCWIDGLKRPRIDLKMTQNRLNASQTDLKAVDILDLRTEKA